MFMGPTFKTLQRFKWQIQDIHKLAGYLAITINTHLMEAFSLENSIL